MGGLERRLEPQEGEGWASYRWLVWRRATTPRTPEPVPGEAERLSGTAGELRKKRRWRRNDHIWRRVGRAGEIDFMDVVRELAVAVAAAGCRRNAHPTGAWPAHLVRSRTQTIIPP